MLRKTYGVTLTPALLEAEVQRINTTTRAPDMLAEAVVFAGTARKVRAVLAAVC